MTTNRFGTPASWYDNDTTDSRMEAQDAREARHAAAQHDARLSEWGVQTTTFSTKRS